MYYLSRDFSRLHSFKSSCKSGLVGHFWSIIGSLMTVCGGNHARLSIIVVLVVAMPVQLMRILLIMPMPKLMRRHVGVTHWLEILVVVLHRWHCEVWTKLFYDDELPLQR